MQFAILSAIPTSQYAEQLRTMILDGRLREAAASVEVMLLEDTQPRAPGEIRDLAELCGDLMLALDRPEEAEAIYRQAVLAAARADDRGATRLSSCRATGMMSLHSRRLRTAASCFQRIAGDQQASPRRRVDALCALARARHGMGQVDRAVASLDDAASLAAQEDDSLLQALVTLLRLEISAQRQLRAHEALRDHVFWHTQNESSSSTAALPPLQAIGSCLLAYGQHRFIAQGLTLYRDLLTAGLGDLNALAALPGHLAARRRAGHAALEHSARVEAALVAITARNSELARALIDPLQSNPWPRRWNMETLYCLSKLSALTGRIDDALRWYQSYALESVQCVRAEVLSSAPSSTSAIDSSSRVDDVEMQLPPKYRRAYRYMIEHLDCAGLSVREVADHLGVSERALQLTFRAHLGLTPAELMQRCRMERIRDDLLREDQTALSVFETAARWGIRNRSTLANSYRKYFRETPTQTLARRDTALAA
ncbi:helix-turn-helix transcriptional regulator [Paucibacter sp. PLA-PC-4]|uniref:helix-turn-helix transcriptional regulator n=1 Tax=Paucibacter sp. PLA-PC-4 TaxID=2993655 RepID=UPI00224ACAED|nr:helix-turn-helix transcriptional regulator [Paucibacter sp. PLA-PC-4]MCX2865584.1 helix-turn-helix transcriptional regulator [Paucibacter sp. PLA-PC-4]